MVKARSFIALVLAVGMAFLAWAVAARETTIEANGPSALDAVSANHAISHPGRQTVVSPGDAWDLSFAPTFTIDIPATFNNYMGCTTIPTLISPANGSNLSTIAPLFRWDKGNNPSATDLQLQVAKDPGFTRTVISYWGSGNAGVGEFRHSENLAPATTYYWRAWVVCRDGRGPYSEVWSFTTGSGGTVLPAPALVTPTNGSTVPSRGVTLQWSPVPGALEYLLRWRLVGEIGYSYQWVNDTQFTQWFWSARTVEWWVSARNDYAIGTDSEVWQFTTPADSRSSQGVSYHFVLEDGTTYYVSDAKE